MNKKPGVRRVVNRWRNSSARRRGTAVILPIMLIIGGLLVVGQASPGYASEVLPSCGGAPTGFDPSDSCQFVFAGSHLTVTGSREGGCLDLAPGQCVSGIAVSVSGPGGQLLACSGTSNLFGVPAACSKSKSVQLPPGTVLTCAVQSSGGVATAQYACTIG